MKKIIILIGVLMISFVFMASASAKYSQTIEKDPCPMGSAITTEFVFVNTPSPGGDGTLTISAIGDYDNDSEYIDVIVEGTTLSPRWFPREQCGANLRTTTYTITKSQIFQWMADGKIEVKLVQGPNVGCFCDNREINIVTLEYPTGTSSLPMQQFMKILGLGKEK